MTNEELVQWRDEANRIILQFPAGHVGSIIEQYAERVVLLIDELILVRKEKDAMRPVVEKAIAYAGHHSRHDIPIGRIAWELETAVDAYEQRMEEKPCSKASPQAS